MMLLKLDKFHQFCLHQTQYQSFLTLLSDVLLKVCAEVNFESRFAVSSVINKDEVRMERVERHATLVLGRTEVVESVNGTMKFLQSLRKNEMWKDKNLSNQK